MADQRSSGLGPDKTPTPPKVKQQAEQQADKTKQPPATTKKNIADEKQKAAQDKLKRDQYLARLEQRRKSRDLNRGR